MEDIEELRLDLVELIQGHPTTHELRDALLDLTSLDVELDWNGGGIGYESPILCIFIDDGDTVWSLARTQRHGNWVVLDDGRSNPEEIADFLLDLDEA